MKIKFAGVVGDGYLLCPTCFDDRQVAAAAVLEADHDDRFGCGGVNCHHGSPARAVAFGRVYSEAAADVLVRLRDEFTPLWEWEVSEDDCCDQCFWPLD